MWDEILWLRQCVTVSQSSCSCILQTRFKMLLAISQMQVRVGMEGERALFGEPGSLGSSTRLCHAQENPRLCQSSPAGPRSWGSGVSGFVAIPCRGAGGWQWVLCRAGWFPAGRGETPQPCPSCPDHRVLCLEDVP